MGKAGIILISSSYITSDAYKELGCLLNLGLKGLFFIRAQQDHQGQSGKCSKRAVLPRDQWLAPADTGPSKNMLLSLGDP